MLEVPPPDSSSRYWMPPHRQALPELGTQKAASGQTRGKRVGNRAPSDHRNSPREGLEAGACLVCQAPRWPVGPGERRLRGATAGV